MGLHPTPALNFARQAFAAQCHRFGDGIALGGRIQPHNDQVPVALQGLLGGRGVMQRLLGSLA